MLSWKSCQNHLTTECIDLDILMHSKLAKKTTTLKPSSWCSGFFRLVITKWLLTTDCRYFLDSNIIGMVFFKLETHIKHFCPLDMNAAVAKMQAFCMRDAAENVCWWCYRSRTAVRDEPLVSHGSYRPVTLKNVSHQVRISWFSYSIPHVRYCKKMMTFE